MKAKQGQIIPVFKKKAKKAKDIFEKEDFYPERSCRTGGCNISAPLMLVGVFFLPAWPVK